MDDNDDWLDGFISGWIMFGEVPKGWFGVIILLIMIGLALYIALH